MPTRPPPHASRGTPAGGGFGRLCACAVLVGVLLVPWFGCSAQRHYKILSFFFDGVPDPNAVAHAGGVDEQGNPVVRVVSFSHKPFEDGQCDACHQIASGRYDDFTKLGDDICLKCHGGVPTSYPRMHGPVALGECSLCHVPHESSERPLLRESSPAVCTTCHVQELLPAEPADHQTKRTCLDCHSGHGGAQRGLLRQGWNTTQPAAPAAAAAPSKPAAAGAAP